MDSASSYKIPSAADIKRLATEAKMSIPTLCARAEVAPSTFYRWLNGESEIKGDLIARLLAVVQAPASPQP